MLTALTFAIGLGLLILGAEGLVRGSSRLALGFGIPSVVVGLTVVSFGTSAPELVVSAKAAWAGQADISLGNVVGSNIMNVLFVLGAAACLAPLRVERKLIRQDVPIMVALSCLLYLLALDGRIGRLDGVLLLILLAGYTWIQARGGMRFGPQAKPPRRRKKMVTPSNRLINAILLAGGLGLLILGAHLVLESAVRMARSLGVSELIIGLTIIAVGTSLPEIATSLLAAWRGEREIAVANAVGSSIFNILAVLGTAAVVGTGGVCVSRAALNFDIPVMTAAAFACLPIFLTGHAISRWEGALFLFYYAAYAVYLILASLQHKALPAFSLAMMAFVIPLTAVTLAVLVFRHIKAWPQKG
jgi:cation:H+ antiporter